MGYIKEHGIKAIVFDIDGTFYPISTMYRNLFLASILHPIFAIRYNRMRQTIREEDGYEALPERDHRELSKRASEIMGIKDVDKFLYKEEHYLHRRWNYLYRSLKSYPDVKETLDEARREKLKLGVLSDFPIGVKLKAMGLQDYFSFELSSEDIGRFKPNGTPFDVIARTLGIDRSSILYVGDSERKDISGGARAGFKTALIARKSIDSKADVVAHDWKELQKKLFD